MAAGASRRGCVNRRCRGRAKTTLLGAATACLRSLDPNPAARHRRQPTDRVAVLVAISLAQSLYEYKVTITGEGSRATIASKSPAGSREHSRRHGRSSGRRLLDRDGLRRRAAQDNSELNSGVTRIVANTNTRSQTSSIGIMRRSVSRNAEGAPSARSLMSYESLAPAFSAPLSGPVDAEHATAVL
jgi:hypothetical protein